MSGLEPSYENIIKQELQIADLKRAYHALMGQAIKMAECITFEFPPDITEVTSANSFLSSPDVLKWREQQEGL